MLHPRVFLTGLALLGGLGLAHPGLANPGGTPALDQRLAALEIRVTALEALSQQQAQTIAAQATVISKFKVADGPYGPKTEITLSGVNLHIVNGNGPVPGLTGSVDTDYFNGVYAHSCNGLGNLVLGYNSPRPFEYNDRSGSHNLVIGDLQSYSSYDGIVAGYHNGLDSPYASGVGGAYNWSRDLCSSVSGGLGNYAFANFSSLSGGAQNTASAPWASISGGQGNVASGWWSAISGGQNNAAGSDHAWAGGTYHTP